MTVELQSLFIVAANLLVLLFIQDGLVLAKQGLKWGLSSRNEPRDKTALQLRIDRAIANHLEGMAVFAPIILIAHLAGISTGLTQMGAVIYVVGRVAFSIVYLIGIPVLRSVTWGIALIGIFLIGAELIRFGF